MFLFGGHLHRVGLRIRRMIVDKVLCESSFVVTLGTIAVAKLPVVFAGDTRRGRATQREILHRHLERMTWFQVNPPLWSR